MPSISSLSLEYIKTRVRAKEGGVEVNPTGNTVQFAFETDEDVEPEAGDWVAGSWETVGSKYYARCLVGPGGTITLTNGTYWVWVKVTDTPEIPVRQVGRLTIT